MISTTHSSSNQWLTALRAAIVFLIVCGGVYPFFTTVVVGGLFPHQSTGSLVERDGRVVGSALVGQRFVSVHYFHSRPSAAGHDPFAVSGSNLAPSNPDLRERIEADAARIARLEGVAPGQIPVDLLAASGGGIDPHISPQAAAIQVDRVARSRGLTPAEIEAQVQRFTDGPSLGIFGQPRVNVLLLNLALDDIAPVQAN